MKYVECKNLNKNKAANSQNYFFPISKSVDINVFCINISEVLKVKSKTTRPIPNDF